MPEPTGRDKKGSSVPTDKQLWRKVTANVEPLKSKRETHGNTPPPAATSSDAPDEEPPAVKRKPVSVPPPPMAKPGSVTEALEVGKAIGVDKRTVARLRRGILPVEAKIDLHNMTQEQAHRALVGFLAAAQARGKRCVLVITGKGLRNPCGAVGVLKNAVPRWLNEPAQRARVLAVTHAPPHLGGDGALLMLLKRIRKDAKAPRRQDSNG